VVPDTSKLKALNWDHRFDSGPGWSLKQDDQLQLLRRLAKWGAEMRDTPSTIIDPRSYYWDNPAFNATDATIYHAIIREFRPDNILEVGSGYSTLVATRAAKMNGNTHVSCIEPYPLDFLRTNGLAIKSLIETPVQQVPLNEFERLGPNDVLFIDSTHVCKPQSDVNYLILQVLPRLRPGVLVHFHDIFLPWDFPKHWITEKRLFWNEQYLLLAFLLYNESFEVQLGTQYLGLNHEAELRAAFPFLPVVGGSSMWLRRVR
jgi:hypothetical protein